jgi:anti-sigma-K factor RskA
MVVDAELIDEDARDEELELYALGLLDRDQSAAVERRLRDDPAARERVRALRGVAAALVHDLEPLEPSPGLRGRILDAARADVQSQVERAAPPGPIVLAERRAAPPGWLPWAAAAALAVLLVASLIWNARLRDEVDQRTPAVAHAVTAQGEAAGVTGTALEIGEDGTILLSLAGLPLPDSGRVYQVWLIADGAPVPNVTFLPTRLGFANVAVSGSAEGFRVLAVTNEPDGGSTAPTTEPLIFSDLTETVS